MVSSMTDTKTLTWANLSARLGRNDLPPILVNAVYENRLTDQREIARGVCSAWVAAEWPTRLVDEQIWLDLFDLATPEGFILTDNADENDELIYKPREELPESLELFRGAWPEFINRMSWTTDIARAKWFAHRFAHKDSGLYTITIPSELVLATFDGRNENEVVIDNSMLMEEDIELIHDDGSRTVVDFFGMVVE